MSILWTKDPEFQLPQDIYDELLERCETMAKVERLFGRPIKVIEDEALPSCPHCGQTMVSLLAEYRWYEWPCLHAVSGCPHCGTTTAVCSRPLPPPRAVRTGSLLEFLHDLQNAQLEQYRAPTKKGDSPQG